MNPPEPEALPGFAHRHENWHDVTAVSSLGRRTMGAIPNYKLLKAATQIDAGAATRLLLVHLIGYLGVDDPTKTESRFVVFPGNTRLATELRCTVRSIQRQADELEAAGLIRRCYNGVNRRIGFDLTPFAMQHESICADIVAVHTRIKQERNLAQMELSLEADRIHRPDPSATTASSQGDAGVAHNRPDHNKNDDGASAASALDAIDIQAFAAAGEHLSVCEDRTQDHQDAILASINSRFTGGGRISHLGWVSALNALGRHRAVALYLVAELDPRRRATPERYFGWLLRTCASGDSSILEAAATRAADKVAGRAPSRPARVPAASTRDEALRPAPRAIGPIAAALRSDIGATLYDTWVGNATVTAEGGTLHIEGTSAFGASWIRSHLAENIERSAARHVGRPLSLRVTAKA